MKKGKKWYRRYIGVVIIRKSSGSRSGSNGGGGGSDWENFDVLGRRSHKGALRENENIRRCPSVEYVIPKRTL